MFVPSNSPPAPQPSSYGQKAYKALTTICFQWTPKIVCAYYIGCYGLGYAYKEGIMFRIQLQVMQFFFPKVGYAGLGLIMPQIDWYTSKAVFTLCFLAGSILYNLCERILLIIKRSIFPERSYPLPA